MMERMKRFFRSVRRHLKDYAIHKLIDHLVTVVICVIVVLIKSKMG